jgi:DNA-binding winged helix-turn-helix (wHTH) protein
MHGNAMVTPGLPPGTSALGHMPTLQCGPLRLDPPMHRVRGPAGEAALEPKMMLVLVTLAGAEGAVVTRQQLFEVGWAGTLVGDEALNRAIAGVRKALAAAGGGASVETIPRTGYRLVIPAQVPAAEPASVAMVAAPELSAQTSRRQWMLGLATVAGVGLAGGWWLLRPQRAAAAMVRKGQTLLDIDPDLWREAATLAEQAIVLAPDDADAWGLKARAMAERLQYMPTGDDPVMVRATLEEAASRALALQPEQEDARVALVVAEPFFGAWHGADQKLAAILVDVPMHRQALLYRAELLCDCGLYRQAEALLAPLTGEMAPMRRAVWLRILVLAAMAEKADVRRMLELWRRHWPDSDGLRRAEIMAQLQLGQPERALALLDQLQDTGALLFPPGVAAAKQNALRALLAGNAAAIARAAAVAEEVSVTRISAAHFLLPILSLLGATDSAYRVADALYRGRGPLALPATSPNGGSAAHYQQMRRAEPLFEPTADAMRADPRFWPLARDIGLLAAWRAMSRKPDFLGARPMRVLRMPGGANRPA